MAFNQDKEMYMANNTKKTAVIKSNISKSNQLIAQQELLEERALLEKEREKLGFDVFSLNEFLMIHFDKDYGLEQQSECIALQKKYKILEECKIYLR